MIPRGSCWAEIHKLFIKKSTSQLTETGEHNLQNTADLQPAQGHHSSSCSSQNSEQGTQASSSIILCSSQSKPVPKSPGQPLVFSPSLGYTVVKYKARVLTFLDFHTVMKKQRCGLRSRSQNKLKVRFSRYTNIFNVYSHCYYQQQPKQNKDG